MRKLVGLMLALVCVIVLASCNNNEDSIANFKEDEIEKIVITLAMGNTEYGADSKIITDKTEIAQMIEVFNSAVLGSIVGEENLGVGATSTYAFYDDEKCLKAFEFNVNDSEILFWGEDPREVIYTDKLPYHLYNESNAETITVDLQGNELSENHVSMVNSLVEVESSEMLIEALDIRIDAPMNPKDIEYYILSDKIAQIIYVLDDKEFVLRASKSVGGRELSGIYGDFEMTSFVACGDTVSVTVDTVELEDGSAFATSTVEILDKDDIYLSLSTTNEIDGEEISSMINEISYQVADE